MGAGASVASQPLPLTTSGCEVGWFFVNSILDLDLRFGYLVRALDLLRVIGPREIPTPVRAPEEDNGDGRGLPLPISVALSLPGQHQHQHLYIR